MRAQLVLVSVPRLPLKGVRSMSPGPDFRGADRERCVSYFTLLWWSKNTLSAVANDLCVVVGSSGDPLPPLHGLRVAPRRGLHQLRREDALLAASAAGMLKGVAMRLTRRRTRSAANSGRRSTS